MASAAERMAWAARFCLLRAAPILMTLLWFANVLMDPNSRWLRIAIFLTYFILGLKNLRLSFVLLLVSCLWFETTILALGFPNQFVIEIAAVGCMAAAFVQTNRGNAKFGSIKALFAHPFVPLGIFTVGATVLSIASFAGQLKYLAPEFRPPLFLSLIIRRLWDWDAVSNPIHGATIAFGYLIQIIFYGHLFAMRATLFPRRERILDYLIMGFWPVLACALFQHLAPELRFARLSLDYGGTLQNGNHLSFVAAIVMLLVAALAAERGKFSTSVNVSLLLSLIGLIAGNGRTSWLALGISGVCLAPLLWSRLRRKGPQHTKTLVAIGLLACSIIIAIGSFTNIANDVLYYWRNATSVLSQVTLTKLAYIGGRKEHLEMALNLIRQHPWVGYGPGNFMSMTGSPLDIHNVFIGWLWQFGFLGVSLLVVTTLYFGVWIFHLLRFQGQDISKLCFAALCLILLLSLPIDTYLSFRSIALFVGILFCYFIDQFEHQVWQNTSKILCIVSGVLGIIAGSLTIKAPLMHVPAMNREAPMESAAGDPTDRDPSYNFSWYGMSASKLLEPGMCLSMGIRATPGFSENHLTASRVHGNEILTFWGLNQSPNSAIRNYRFIVSDSWHTFCFCLNPDPTCTLSNPCYLKVNADHGAYLSTLFPLIDDRFVAFGLRGSTYAPMQEKNSVEECEYLAQF